MILEKKKELRHIHHVATLLVLLFRVINFLLCLVISSHTLDGLFYWLMGIEAENSHHHGSARRHRGLEMMIRCLKVPSAKGLMAFAVMSTACSTVWCRAWW